MRRTLIIVLGVLVRSLGVRNKEVLDLGRKCKEMSNKELDLVQRRSAGLNFEDMGAEIVSNLSDDARSKLCSKCHTLHYVKLLKLTSKRADRAVANGVTTRDFKSVGIVLYSDEDIDVPDIPGYYTKETGIPPDDVKSRRVKAGEFFFLTYYEFMFLVLRPEYSGYCSRDNDPFGVVLSLKMTQFKEGRAKLPTIAIKFVGRGSPKEAWDAIDEYDEATDSWCIKEKYQEKFGHLLTPVQPTKAPDAMDGKPKLASNMVGLSALLKDKYGYEF